jgi:hypothetical protein
MDTTVSTELMDGSQPLRAVDTHSRRGHWISEASLRARGKVRGYAIRADVADQGLTRDGCAGK